MNTGPSGSEPATCREREARRCESRFDVSLRLGSDLEGSSRGIQYLIDYLEYVKQEVHDGTVSGESYKWLEQQFRTSSHRLTRPS